MGVYDIIRIGDREGQVKCFDSTLTDLTTDALVGPLNGSSTYDIAMREGGFVHVTKGRIVGWTDTAVNGVPVFDKYGAPWSGVENRGELGDAYAFPHRHQ